MFFWASFRNGEKTMYIYINCLNDTAITFEKSIFESAYKMFLIMPDKSKTLCPGLVRREDISTVLRKCKADKRQFAISF